MCQPDFVRMFGSEKLWTYMRMGFEYSEDEFSEVSSKEFSDIGDDASSTDEYMEFYEMIKCNSRSRKKRAVPAFTQLKKYIRLKAIGLESGPFQVKCARYERRMKKYKQEIAVRYRPDSSSDDNSYSKDYPHSYNSRPGDYSYSSKSTASGAFEEGSGEEEENLSNPAQMEFSLILEENASYFNSLTEEQLSELYYIYMTASATRFHAAEKRSSTLSGKATLDNDYTYESWQDLTMYESDYEEDDCPMEIENLQNLLETSSESSDSGDDGDTDGEVTDDYAARADFDTDGEVTDDYAARADFDTDFSDDCADVDSNLSDYADLDSYFSDELDYGQNITQRAYINARVKRFCNPPVLRSSLFRSKQRNVKKEAFIDATTHNSEKAGCSSEQESVASVSELELIEDGISSVDISWKSEFTSDEAPESKDTNEEVEKTGEAEKVISDVEAGPPETPQPSTSREVECGTSSDSNISKDYSDYEFLDVPEDS